MEFNEVLLWMAGPALAILAYRGIQQASRGAIGLLMMVLAMAAVGGVVRVAAPGYEGAVLLGLLLVLVMLPALAMVRVYDAFDRRQWARARAWLRPISVLQWLPGQRQQLAVIRHIIDLESGLTESLEPQVEGLARLSLDTHRLAFEARWDELAALVDAQPEGLRLREPTLIATRLRAACELGEWDLVLRLHRELEARASAAKPYQRASHAGRVAVLAVAGEVDGLAALCPTAPSTTHEDTVAYYLGWARWARGEEAEGRRLIEQVAERGSLRLRAAAQHRLAHPPTPVAELPHPLRLVAGAMGSAATGAATAPKHPPRFVRTLVGANVAVFVGMMMAGNPDRLATLMRLGALPSPAVGEATWWRFGASMFLHVDIVHLGMNMIGLAVFGGALERRFGLWRVLPLYLVAGLVGNVLWWSIASWRQVDEFAVGASGCIMGLVGAMAVTLIREWRAGGSALGARLIVLQIVLQWVFDASHPNVAASAHFGGLIAGALLALALFPRPNRAAPR